MNAALESGNMQHNLDAQAQEEQEEEGQEEDKSPIWETPTNLCQTHYPKETK